MALSIVKRLKPVVSEKKKFKDFMIGVFTEERQLKVAIISIKNRSLFLTGFLCMALHLISGCSHEKKTSYTLHGIKIEDKYLWMEDSQSKKLQTWIQMQNNTSKKVLNDLQEKKWLIQQFQNPVQYEEGVRIEVLNSKRVFYWRKKPRESYKVYCTRENSTAPEEVLINPNEWKNNHYADVEKCYPSPDGRYVAFLETIGGDDFGGIKILDVKSKKVLSEKIIGLKQIFNCWDENGFGFYYSASDLKKEGEASTDKLYWVNVYHHQIGTPASEDRKIFYDAEHKDYWHSANLTEDKKYLILYRLRDNSNYEAYLQKPSEKSTIQPIATGMDGYYNIGIYNEKLFVQTDYKAPNGQVFITDVNQPQKKHWKIFLPEKQAILQNIIFANKYIYAVYLENAYTKIKIYDFNGKFIRDLPLPGLGTASVSGYWSKGPVYVEYESFLQPKTTYAYNLKENKINLIIKNAYAYIYNTSDLEVEQVWYCSKDNTPISMFLIKRKNLAKNSNHPVILEGYGGFNISITPSFNEYDYYLASQGVIIAWPNLRGGGEYGKKWHQAGMKEKKQNTIDDYISAAEWLIANHYTNPNRLAAFGGSNGGLTVAAAMVQRPDLFKVVVCDSALLDMLRYDQFNYAEMWKDEYGISKNKDQFDYLIKYSPYYNVNIYKKYPDILFTVSKDDSRVAPLHSFKMVEKMQRKKVGNVILLAMYDNIGHQNGDIGDASDKFIDKYAFVLKKLHVELDFKKGEH